MAILTPAQLQSSNASTYTTNGANLITGANARNFNVDWISSSVLLNANNNISGSQVISGSLRLIGNGDRLTITGSVAGAATTFSDRTMNALAYQAPGVDVASQLFSSDTATAGQYIGALKSDFSVDVEHAIIVSTSSITLNDWDNNGGVYVPYLTIAPNTGNNPPPQFKRNVSVTGSVNISNEIVGGGSVTVGGNVTAASGIVQSQIFKGNNNNTVYFQSQGASGKVEIFSTSGGSGNLIRLNSAGNVSITGSTQIKGDLTTTGSLTVTGSVNIAEALRLQPQSPLPTGTVGSLAVSASNLFFYNGAWTQVI